MPDTKRKGKTPEQLLSMDPISFLNWINAHFSFETSSHMESPDDANRGLDMMNVQARMIEYLRELDSYAKVYARDLKRKGSEFKMEYEDMVDRREIIENEIDAIKISYQTTNKCISVFMENNRTPQEAVRKDWRRTGA
jgi:hypothetical protein